MVAVEVEVGSCDVEVPVATDEGTAAIEVEAGSCDVDVPVATDEGTVNVEPPANTIVCTPAGFRSAAGHPTPLQGLLSQQP